MPIKFIGEAHMRAQRRKSKWNLLLIPFWIFGIVISWILLASFIAAVHTAFYPTHGFGQSKTELGGILMFVPLVFPSISIGGMLANLFVWCIPPARKTLEQEAKGYPRASFRSSMRDLGKATAILLPIALVLSLLGAIDPF